LSAIATLGAAFWIRTVHSFLATHETSVESLNEFSFKFDIGELTKICSHIPVVVKIGQQDIGVF